ncbi:HAD-IA family hydrolase [uncultured Oxalicibacterium sp.]|uniref:HAD family hydrolase n=1 Tax=uncultured Oxalicibacterium sp. TaxID=1168540 RepID=UPI0025FA628E|nr:HAD-IA family hydrolase [uncultured Oxalicibacterium sp.]
MKRKPQAILFDLDGTLADTAPDLAGAVNLIRISQGLPAVDYEILRPVASAGARGLIGAAFGISPADSAYPALRDAFLENYTHHIAEHSRLFDGIDTLLNQIEHAGIQWGIVTNKATALTEKLVPQIGLNGTGCVVCGDTTPHPKPHPAPLFEAARRLDVPPEACWYVGDDLRDVQAGKAANMVTIAAGWGYCGETQPTTWDADEVSESPAELGELLRDFS